MKWLLLLSLALFYPMIVGCVYVGQRKILFLPTHGNPLSRLQTWEHNGEVIGYCRQVANAKHVWLMLHGNAGQAAHRDYVLNCISEQDSVFVLEYPGYGQRLGKPSKESFNAAAAEAFEVLRGDHPGKSISVLGESIGSGPACSLAGVSDPPERIVLVTPFDALVALARNHFPWLPVSWIVRDDWDNIQALDGYTGEVWIYGAKQDRVIPIEHARQLKTAVSSARLIELECGHNDWPIMSGKLGER